MKVENTTGILYRKYQEYGIVGTDSRSIVPGAIFFALRGPSFDGNKFALQALEKGAECVVVDDRAVIDAFIAAGGADEVAREKIILVKDTLEALQALAARHRLELRIPILAITGTNGKTTTKELTAAVLSRKYKVYATQGNLNNHIGVPLTILAMDRSAELGIVEMGASARGEIALLCEIARPDYGMITNIGLAHLEGFGGADGIRKGKGELYDYLARNGGTAIVRQDDPVLYRMAAERHGLKTIAYDAAFAEGFESALDGDYNRFNIAAAVAIARVFGVPENDVREAISAYEPQNHRSQRITTARNTIIADCYNANPSSMAAAVNNFLKEKQDETEATGNFIGYKKVLILGDMLELGEWAAEEHSKIIKLALSGDPDLVLFAGTNFMNAGTGMRQNFEKSEKPQVLFFPGISELLNYLQNNPVNNSHILVKGSRGIALEQALAQL